jgi:hypothetical protein
MVEIDREVRNAGFASIPAHVEQWIVFGSAFGSLLYRTRFGFDPDDRAFRQTRPRLQHHDTVFDCSAIAHKTLGTNTTKHWALANAIRLTATLQNPNLSTL